MKQPKHQITGKVAPVKTKEWDADQEEQETPKEKGKQDATTTNEEATRQED